MTEQLTHTQWDSLPLACRQPGVDHTLIPLRLDLGPAGLRAEGTYKET